MGTLSRRVARLAIINGQPTTTSREIAATFGRQHKNIVQRIKAIECSEEFRSANFSAHPYTDPQNGQEYTEYRITKDGFAFLCMGFTGPKAALFKERYIARFNHMAEKLAKKQQKQHPAHIESAQCAIKQIAHSSAPQVPACQDHGPIDPTNPRNLPALPDGLAWPAGLEQAIEARCAELAIQSIPALREYLRRHMAYTAHSQHTGWASVSHQLQALEQASLQDAFAYQESQAIQTAAAGLRAVQRVVQAALQTGETA